jgi:hypothetical protein
LSVETYRASALLAIAALVAVSVACTQEAQTEGLGGTGGGQTVANDGAITTVGGGGGGGGGGGMSGSGGAVAEAGNGGNDPMDAGQNPEDAAGTSPTTPDGGVDAGIGDNGTPICGTTEEDGIAVLECPEGEIIVQVAFASYGTPEGECGGFAVGSCHAATAISVVEGLCLGRASCTVPASNASFGDPCRSTVKRLAIEVRCVPGTPTVTPGPFKGVANSPCNARTRLGVSWYYNWGQTETEPCSDGRGGEFVPMIWGHPGAEQDASGIATAVASFVGSGYGHVLGFNEPDNPDQSNIPVQTAIELWPSFDVAGIEVVSPGTAANANPGQAWFSDFMAQLDNNPSLRVDVLAIHWYGWNSGSCDAAASQLENYIRWAEGFAGGRPIWITEWGCLNQSAPNAETVVAFYQGALSVFDRHPRIERYAWYPWSSNCGLVNPDGSLTALGEAYAAAPAYK